MTCPHCHATEGYYTLEDGRIRCSSCFATFEEAKTEAKSEQGAEREHDEGGKAGQKAEKGSW